MTLAENLDLDPRDLASQSATPALMVPRYGKLPELAIGHTRYLIARDGIYIEARSRAAHGRLRVSAADALPFGTAEPFLRLAGGPIPAEIHRQILEAAYRALPNEYAALVLWRNGSYELHQPEVLDAAPHRITYASGGYDPLELVLDVHSHAHGAAYFSSQDDADDLLNPSPCFMAGVLGKVGGPEVEECTRVVLNGRVASTIDVIAEWLGASFAPFQRNHEEASCSP